MLQAQNKFQDIKSAGNSTLLHNCIISKDIQTNNNLNTYNIPKFRRAIYKRLKTIFKKVPKPETNKRVKTEVEGILHIFYQTLSQEEDVSKNLGNTIGAYFRSFDQEPPFAISIGKMDQKEEFINENAFFQVKKDWCQKAHGSPKAEP